MLTLHRIPALIDPTEVFAMLCEQQLHMLPDSAEHHRALTDAPDAPVERAGIWMTLTTAEIAHPAPEAHHGAAPTTAPRQAPQS